MGYALIWIESLAAALMLVALAAVLWNQAAPRPKVLAFVISTGLLAWVFGSYAATSDWQLPLVVGLLVLEAGAFFFWIRRKGWEQGSGMAGVAGTLLVAALLLAPAAAVSAATGLLKFGLMVPNSWFGYALSWTLLYIAGAAWVLREGWRHKEGVGRAAAAWPLNRLALATAAAVMVTSMTFWNLDLGVRTRLNDLRTEAGAMALAVIPPRVPETENAALVYMQSFEVLPESSKWPQAWHDRYVSWTNGFDAKRSPVDMGAGDRDLADFLAAHEQSLKLLRRAVRMPGCEFERDWSQGLSMPLWDLGKMRNAARILSIDARREAALGHLKAAFEDAGAIFGVARHVRRDPILISALVAQAVDGMGLALLGDLFERTRPSLDDLRGVELDDAVSYNRLLLRSMQMEEAMGIASFASISQGDTLKMMQMIGDGDSSPETGPALRGLFSPLARLFLLLDDLESYRSTMREARMVATNPYAQSNAMWKNIFPSGDFKDLAGQGLVTRALTSVFPRMHGSFATADARYRVARTVLAMARYRAEHGRLPAKLEELSPAYLAAVPADPFDGKPLRLVTDARGVTVYSIGLDAKDDGGDLSDDPKLKDMGVRLTP
jgi:hypothetical protein